MGPEPLILTSLGISWLAGWLLHLRIVPGRHRGSRAAASGSVSVIIPARDEAANLPRLLASLHAQSAVVPLEVLVVDDASTDGTADVARAHGATVIEAGPLPDGWRGKPWACWRGAEAAGGERLLFMDADTWFEAEGLGRLLSLHQVGASSACPWHAVERPSEQLSAFFNLLMLAGTVPRGLFGQVLLVDREDYFRVGGHAAVKDRVLENFHLAATFRDSRIPTRGFAGRRMISMRMYPGGLREIAAGWGKGFLSGAKGTSPILLGLVSLWFGGLCCATATLACLPWGLGAYALFALQTFVLLRVAGAFRWWTALLYPLPLLFQLLVLGGVVLRRGKPSTWKGRVIDAR